VKHGTQDDVFLNDICRQAEAGPIQANIEVAITIEVIRAHEHVEISDTVDHHEEDEQDCRTSEACAVT